MAAKNLIPTHVPFLPASLDVGKYVRSFVLKAFEEKAAEIRRGGRFQNRGGMDDAGRFHERGGFWNTDLAHAVAGYGKGDVAEVSRALRGFGISLDDEDVDTVLGQLVYTGRLDGVALRVAVLNKPSVTVRLDDDRDPDPPHVPKEIRVRNYLIVEQRPGTYLVRPVVDGHLLRSHVVIVQNDLLVCSCGADPCPHASVVADLRSRSKKKLAEVLALTSFEDSVVVQTALAILERRGLYRTTEGPRKRGNQPRTVPERALQLILRELLGRDWATKDDVAELVRLGIIDAPAGATSLERYRKDAAVIALLCDVRAVATRGVRGRVVLAWRMASDRGDHIARDIVWALQTDYLFAKYDEPNPMEESS